MNDKQIKHMVDRFLGWKSPDNFNPDGGITFTREVGGRWPRKNEPTGTNVFDATQAEAMVRHMVEELPVFTVNCYYCGGEPKYICNMCKEPHGACPKCVAEHQINVENWDEA